MTTARRGRSRTSETVFAGYLALAMAVGPLAHYAMSALGPLVVADLNLSATQFGWLWFVAFGAASVLTIGGGKLTDRLGPRRILVVVFGCAAGALFVVGSARSMAWLLAGIALSGVVQAVSNPATNLVIATEVATHRRGLFVGVKQSGVQVGQFFAGLALPPLALWAGWRNAVLACGVVAVAGLPITFRAVRPSPRRPHSPRGTAPAARSGIWWLTGYSCIIGATIQASNVYLPLYAHQALGASLTRAGLVAAVLGGFGVVARLAWGRLADAITDLRALLAWLAALAGLAICFFALAAYAGEWLLWLGAALFSLSALAANVVVMVAVVQVASPDNVGHATGRPSLGLYVGFMLGPLLFGAAVDSTGGYLAAWAGLFVLTMMLVVLVRRWSVHAVAGEAA